MAYIGVVPSARCCEQAPEFSFIPRVDIQDTESAVNVHAELPGVNKDHVDLKFLDGVLTLSGERKMATDREGEGWKYCERSYGKFSRSFRLPPTCKPSEIKAKFDHGVLQVSIPKAKPVTPTPHSIAIE
eukprot:Filipodium_phascolosomae@DN2544_c0_g1_i1.p1